MLTVYDHYRIEGPRYASYPGADDFHAGFGAAAWRRAAQASNDEPIPAPLSLYLHVPFCPSACHFCTRNRVVTGDAAEPDLYVAYLQEEIALQSSLFDGDREVVQLHLGGGTPGTLGMAGLATVMAALHRHFRLATGASREFAIALDPRSTDRALLAFVKRLGFNRVSFGVHELDPDVQRAVNRVQPIGTLGMLDVARTLGFSGINVGLVCGLPRQTPDGFGATLRQVIAHAPDRIALSNYLHRPSQFEGQRLIDPAELPDADTRLAMRMLADELLQDAGYVMVGLEHYALPGDTQPAKCDLVGLGVSAISMLGDCYAQNSRNLKGYFAALDAGTLPIVRGYALTVDDMLRRDVIQTLLSTGRVRYLPLERRYGVDFCQHFAAEMGQLRQLVDDGLVAVDTRGFELLPPGRAVMRAAAAVFDGYRLFHHQAATRAATTGLTR